MAETGYGYCQCGCGQKTPIAPQTRSARGWIKGEPVRFMRGHATRQPSSTCSMDGCNGIVLARGLCRKHYQQAWRTEKDPGLMKEYQQRYDERHPGRRRKLANARYAADPATHVRYSRRSLVKRKYGLTLEEYEVIIAKGCAICRNHGPRMALDHCHITGKNREALCNNCNNGLGRFKDDPVLLRAAADYLERHR